MVGVLVVTQRDFGEMLDAEHRAVETGNVNRKNAEPLQEIETSLGEINDERPMLRSFFIPILVLAATVVGGSFLIGYAPGRSAIGIIEKHQFHDRATLGNLSDARVGLRARA